MKRWTRHIQAAAIAAVLLISPDGQVVSAPDENIAEPNRDFFYVKRVIDGDTLELSNFQKVRLIGVDTPEVHRSDKLERDARRSRKDILTIQALGQRSSNFTKALCAGKRVRLEYDAERRDKYNRILAYVYLEDGTFVNAKILEEGYGQIMTIPPNVKHARLFLKLQNEAREGRRGLWKD